MLKSEVDESKIKITHTMADGTVRDSIEGYKIPYNDDTKILYNIMAQWIKNKVITKS